MTLKCKAGNCGSEKIRGPEVDRYVCLECGSIFVTDPYECPDGGSSKTWIGNRRTKIRDLPECYGNYDERCKICLDECERKSHCVNDSPPRTDADTLNVESLGSESPIKCLVCGSVDQGRFCSECGAELRNKEPSGFALNAIRAGIVKDWPKYGRTVQQVLYSPNAFFKGAFSDTSMRFHNVNGTLEPTKYLAHHVTVIGLWALLLNYLLGTSESIEILELLWSGAIDLLIQLAWMFVPASLLVFFIRLQEKKRTRRFRRVTMTEESRTSVDNVIRALPYVTTVEILSLPAWVLLFMDAETDALFFISIALAVLSKLLSQVWLAPLALMYSCRIAKTTAQGAVAQLIVFPLAIFCLARACATVLQHVNS